MITVMVWFGFGVVVGVTLSTIGIWFQLNIEWWNRRRVEADVRKLMEHFACGQGYVGCTGGRHCNLDHK